jgi:hypothetical protein
LSDYKKLQIPIPENPSMTTMTDHQLWDLDTFDSKIMEAIQILDKCKSKYDIEVMADRKRQKEFYDKKNRAHHANSKKKRMYNLPHKYAMPPLPGVMKRNEKKEGMVTGQDLNESWGHQLDLNSSFKMPTFPTETAPPWLDPLLWADTRERLAPFQKDLMQNTTSIELSNYVQNVGTPAPGIDRIKFEVLIVMLYHPDFEGFGLENLVLSLAKNIIFNKRFPGSMKEALLTFIPKDRDPLLHTNYRGIALLSLLYKVVTEVLNYRLTRLLRDHGGMEINQGRNKKGVNAAHKAAVLINVITDARMQRKPLHIIYTDIKKAFPSTPYEAFHDATGPWNESGFYGTHCGHTN